MKKNRHPTYLPYLYGVVGFGIAAMILSISDMFRGEVNYHWVFLASLTVITRALSVKIPGIDSRISIEYTFIFTNLVLFGPAAGTLTAALQGLMGFIRAKTVKRRFEFTLFTMGALALSAYISGQVFFSLLGRGPISLDSGMSLREIVLPVGVLALVNYLFNSGSVSIIIALDSREKIYQIWVKNFRWTSIAYFAGASVAAFIAANLNFLSPAVLGVTIPIVLITYFTYHTYREKVEGHIQSLKELSKLYLRTVESLALAVDAKDQTTYGHVRRVRAYALGLARLRGITDTNELLAIETGALLHDIGKLAVDDYILNKPGRLSQREFETMKVHATAGEEILNHVQFPYPVARLVRAHHEQWDGKGYPDGLKGEEIPLGARMLMIADTFDALRSSRPYKVARGIQESIQELRDNAGSRYDPNLVELFIKNIDKLEAESVQAVKNMPQLSFRTYSGKSESGVRTVVPRESNPLPPPSLGVSAELIALSEFCSSLGRQLLLSDLLIHMECCLRRLLPFSTCAFFLDDGENALQLAYAGGRMADRMQNLRIKVGSGISGWAAAYGHPVINAEAALEFQNFPGDFSSLTIALVVPMNMDGQCLGTISLYAEAPTQYTDDSLRILQMVANQLVPVLAEVWPITASSSSQDLVDPITEAHRARHLAFAGAELITSCSSSSSLSLIYIELRKLPEIIELHGPQLGDSVLRRVAKAIRAEIREGDILARFGQQDFVAILTGIGKDHALSRTEQIRKQISDIRVGNMQAIVCRTGTASYPEDGTAIYDLLDAARRALESFSQRQEGLNMSIKRKILNFRP